VRILLIAAMLALTCGGADLEDLYKRKYLFDLRDAVAKQEAPAFYRAVVACSFAPQECCPGEVKAFLEANPDPKLAIAAYDRLFEYHMARAQWAEALVAVEREVAIGGESQDPQNLRAMCRAFLRHGPMTAQRIGYSKIHVLYKNAHVPITANGKHYSAYVDTGANLSLLSESAVEQLGLPVETVESQFGGAAGHQIGIKKIAVAERFVIGNVELRNVPFLIVSDKQQPFASWGSGKRCVLGVQVLLAARNMTWKSGFPGAELELARPSAQSDPAGANFCLYGMTPLAAGQYQGKRLMLHVDTGAGKSVLRAAFGAAFPAMIESAGRKIITFEGIDGVNKVEAAFLPVFTLDIGGHPAGFRNIAVYLKGHGADEYDGMLGNDIAGKAGEFSIDFVSGRMILR
jgi:hypothetical protein